MSAETFPLSGERPTTLPIELYRSVIENVRSRGDLCTLARTSRYTQPEAERLIYRYLDFESFMALIDLCKRVCTISRFAALVLDLRIRPPTIPYTFGISVLVVLSKALKRLINLRSLHLFLPPSIISGPASLSRLFVGTTFRLKVFTTNSALDRFATAFLEDQSDIVDLELVGIDDVPANDYLDAHILPKLISLGVRSNLTAYFLHDRRITHLGVVGDCSIENIPCLSSPSVTALKIVPFAPHSMELVRNLPEVLPHLEILCGPGIFNEAVGQQYTP
jgi:hypothetical protein